MPVPGSSETNTWPPPSPPDADDNARAARVQREIESKQVSDAIDKAIALEKAQRKRQIAVKLLLLGQAESGKSTVLKNFQLRFAPNTFQAEAELWRPFIHLNLVRLVNFILDILSESRPLSPSNDSDSLKRIRLSLRPLKQVEQSITKQVSGSPLPYLHVLSDSEAKDVRRYHPEKASEVLIRSGMGWKGFMKLRRHEAIENEPRVSMERIEDEGNRRILTACADDIRALWMDPDVRELLSQKAIALAHQPGFFLDDVDRITAADYMPSHKDILRARVRTIGPEEHRIPMDSNSEQHGKYWILYDVGGSRSQRVKWAQFFDDVTAIIFLAPISAFNQVLAEDNSVNRLADSFALWKMICSNKLLQSVNLILLLNKMDILESHLKAGIQFSRYVPKYKGPNEAEPVSKYLLDGFIALHNQYSPRKRKVQAHITCAVDSASTSVVISQIQELLLVKSLSETNIL